MEETMKITRNHTIDYEVALKLQKEDNASELVNKLLIEHYGKNE